MAILELARTGFTFSPSKSVLDAALSLRRNSVRRRSTTEGDQQLAGARAAYRIWLMFVNVDMIQLS